MTPCLTGEKNSSHFSQVLILLFHVVKHIEKTKNSKGSEFEKNIDQYGYTINEDGTWCNNLWTSAEANKVSKDWFQSDHRGKGWDYSCWDYIGLLGLGYTQQQIAAAKINKSVLIDFVERKLKFLMSYKEKLINLT